MIFKNDKHLETDTRLWKVNQTNRGDNDRRSLTNTNKDDLPFRKTKARRSGSSALTRLIVSKMNHYSAVKLCEDDFSYGPDSVSFSENPFCDMELKEHYPLCVDCEGCFECYDFETHHLMTANGGVARNYPHVLEWAEDLVTA